MSGGIKKKTWDDREPVSGDLLRQKLKKRVAVKTHENVLCTYTEK